MKSPFVKTAFLAIVAALVSGAAFAFYPWPETVVESDLVNKPLFESYDATNVRAIRIEKFNEDKQVVERMLLERSGEKWIIPGMKKFVSTTSTQLAMTTKSLNELTVLEEVTSDQQEFISYGVVDPADFAPGAGNGNSIGAKLTLQDRKGRDIASLIVGKSRKNDLQQGAKSHFVRVPGQPAIYRVEFNKDVLKTGFTNWVDPNLLMLSASLPGFITIDNYRIDKQAAGVTPKYRSKLEFNGRSIAMVDFESPGADGKFVMMEPSTELANQVQAMGIQIGNIRFPDVAKKPSKLAKAFKKPLSSADDSLFEKLKQIGFIKTGFKDETFDFDAFGGEISVSTADAVKTTLYIGDVAPNAISEGGRLSRYVLICAGVDETMLKMPPKPADPEDKEYLRLLQQREVILKAARVRASGINQRHADWLYLVPENVIEGIRPPVDLTTVKPKAKAEATNADPPASAAGNTETPSAKPEDQASAESKEKADSKEAPVKEQGKKSQGSEESGEKDE